MSIQDLSDPAVASSLSVDSPANLGANLDVDLGVDLAMIELPPLHDDITTEDLEDNSLLASQMVVIRMFPKILATHPERDSKFPVTIFRESIEEHHFEYRLLLGSEFDLDDPKSLIARIATEAYEEVLDQEKETSNIDPLHSARSEIRRCDLDQFHKAQVQEAISKIELRDKTCAVIPDEAPSYTPWIVQGGFNIVISRPDLDHPNHVFLIVNNLSHSKRQGFALNQREAFEEAMVTELTQFLSSQHSRSA